MTPESVFVRPSKRGRVYQIGERASLCYKAFSCLVTIGLIIAGFSVPVSVFVLGNIAASIYGIIGGGIVVLVGMAGTLAVARSGKPFEYGEPEPAGAGGPFKDAAFIQERDYRPLYTIVSLVTAAILLVLTANVFIWNLIKDQPTNPAIFIILVPSAAVILIRGKQWLNSRK